MRKYNVSEKYCLTLGMLFLTLFCFGQKERTDLEAERKALEQQIKNTTSILQTTQKNKSRTVNELNALNAQIRQRQNLLESINQELKLIAKDESIQEKKIEEAAASIVQLESRLAQALQSAYVRSQLQPEWINLLSAPSLSQALSRWVYMRQYKSYMTRQVEILSDQKNHYEEMVENLVKSRKSKTVLFQDEQKNKAEIQNQQKAQQSLVNELGKEEKKLKSQLTATQEKKKKLDAEIARLIREEAEKMNSSGLSSSPETKALNAQFANNKGKLPWPVSKGLIADQFGEHPHPVLKGIKVQNNGIDILSEENAGVKSLFTGTVASVTKIPGYDYMVMVRHGLYFSVYSKLTKAIVQKGDQVTTGQLLGYLGSEEPKLHLEIWQDKTKLNPSLWLAKK